MIFLPRVPNALGDSSYVSKALDYLRSIQQPDGCISNFATSSWATMAIAAAGEDPHAWAPNGTSIVDYIKANINLLDLDSASDIARFILSMTAAGEDPRNINGTDYIALLEAHFNNGQIGSRQWLFDDFWGIIALVSAGKDISSQIVQDTIRFIKWKQNWDGGWGWCEGASSDVDDTAAAIMALIATGEKADSKRIVMAKWYLQSEQQPDGGFPSWGVTNSASDSWAISAIVAMGEDPKNWKKNGISVVEHLLSLQNDDGSFNWTRSDPTWVDKALMTSYAIIALCHKQYPVNGFPIYLRIEGGSRTIWRGKIFISASVIVDDADQEHFFVKPTALGAVDKASEIGGFSYKVKQTAWGLYLYCIAGEEAAGEKGWLYRVDYYMPWIGAEIFLLNETSPPSPPHKEILWYYSEWGVFPLKISVDNIEVSITGKLTVYVSYFNDDTQTWEPAANVEVHSLSYTFYTNSSGYVTFSVGGVQFPIWAEKSGYVRSDKIHVRVVGEMPGKKGGGGRYYVK